MVVLKPNTKEGKKSAAHLQGDQRQGKSGNFKVTFSNQEKSGKIDLFGEN